MKSASVLSLVLLAGVHARQAQACQTSEANLRKLNFDVVAGAPIVVVAEATAVNSSVGPQRITFTTKEVIKGDVRTGDTFTLFGYRQTTPTKRRDFGHGRAGTPLGGCHAQDYRQGALYLLLLEARDGNWRLGGPPFSRVNEELLDRKGDEWLKAVKLYARLATIPDQKQRMEELQKVESQLDAGVLRDDVRRLIEAWSREGVASTDGGNPIKDAAPFTQ